MSTIAPAEQKPATTKPRSPYVWLAWALPATTLVAVFCILRWAPSPVETAIIVGGVLLIGLAVIGYFGCRRGVVAPFVSVALILPYLLGGVSAYASASRVSDELNGLFDASGSSAEGGPEAAEFSDENGDDVPDDAYTGMSCGDINETSYGSEWKNSQDECLANGGKSGESESGASAPEGAAVEEGPPTLPLDGGTYTWSSGVTMTLEVVKKEPWGSTDDYCGDGSCGVSNPDDLRWVLHYEVSVPKDMPAPFDPMSCPGELPHRQRQ